MGRPQHNPAWTMVNSTLPGINTVLGTWQTWSEWLGSMFEGLFGTSQTTTITTTTMRSMAPVAPVPNVRQEPSPAAAPVLDARQELPSSTVPLPSQQQEPTPRTAPVPNTRQELLPAEARARPTSHVCVICWDPIRGSEVRAPCGHYYDIPCIIDLFQSATSDESLFPPRCCRQNIPFNQVQPHLSSGLVTEFQEKSKEFGTPNRVYCARPTCSHFLGPLTQTSSGTTIYDCPVPNCGTRTCANCRGRYDDEQTHSCRLDQGTQQILELGRREGWVRCPGCSLLVELDMGCFHMTCRCRTEFCYLCKARWKTCNCPQWDGRRLSAAAQQRVDAQLRGGQHFYPFLHGWGPLPEPAWFHPYQPPIAPFVLPGAQPIPPVQQRIPPATVVRPAVPSTAPDREVRTSKRRSGHHRTANTDTVTINTLRQRMIRETAARLQVDHECQHLDWEYRDGGGRCENCHREWGYVSLREWIPLFFFAGGY
ncbi:hypothetical protein EDC04DRAFT_1567750 [Pisolithus marmoratus]|nr:hypothetical protein EDC04DRAFT_1567750 [Pisolithus marmoratus]